MADFAAQRRRHERERQARLKKKKSQRRSSSKKTVIYNASGKVTFSNDPRIKVGSVNESKVRTSSLSKTPSYRGASVVYKRNGAKITESVHRGGKVVSSRVVQDKSTPKSRRTTTTQLASQVRGVKSAQESRYLTTKKVQELQKTREKVGRASVGYGVQMSTADNLINKPYITVGKLLRMRGKEPQSMPNYKVYKNKQGQVIGIQDPFSRKTYRINPTNAKAIKEDITAKQVEREYIRDRRTLMVLGKYQEEMKKITSPNKNLSAVKNNQTITIKKMGSYLDKQLTIPKTLLKGWTDNLKLGYLLANWQNIKTQGQLTPAQARAYMNKVDDIWGYDKLIKDLDSTSTKAWEKSALSGIYSNLRVAGMIIVGVKDVTVGTVITTIKDVAGLGKILYKGTTGLIRYNKKIYKDIFKDIVDLSKRGLDTEEKKRLAFARFKRDLSPYVKFSKGSVSIVKSMARNPEPYLGLLALGVSAGVVSLVDTTRKNPKKLLSEIYSFYLTGQVFKVGGKLLKLKNVIRVTKMPRSGSKVAKAYKVGQIVTDGKTVKIANKGGKLVKASKSVSDRVLKKIPRVIQRDAELTVKMKKAEKVKIIKEWEKTGVLKRGYELRPNFETGVMNIVKYKKVKGRPIRKAFKYTKKEVDEILKKLKQSKKASATIRVSNQKKFTSPLKKGEKQKVLDYITKNNKAPKGYYVEFGEGGSISVIKFKKVKGKFLGKIRNTTKATIQKIKAKFKRKPKVKLTTREEQRRKLTVALKKGEKQSVLDYVNKNDKVPKGYFIEYGEGGSIIVSKFKKANGRFLGKVKKTTRRTIQKIKAKFKRKPKTKLSVRSEQQKKYTISLKKGEKQQVLDYITKNDRVPKGYYVVYGENGSITVTKFKKVNGRFLGKIKKTTRITIRKIKAKFKRKPKVKLTTRASNELKDTVPLKKGEWSKVVLHWEKNLRVPRGYKINFNLETGKRVVTKFRKVRGRPFKATKLYTKKQVKNILDKLKKARSGRVAKRRAIKVDKATGKKADAIEELKKVLQTEKPSKKYTIEVEVNLDGVVYRITKKKKGAKTFYYNLKSSIPNKTPAKNIKFSSGKGVVATLEKKKVIKALRRAKKYKVVSKFKIGNDVINAFSSLIGVSGVIGSRIINNNSLSKVQGSNFGKAFDIVSGNRRRLNNIKDFIKDYDLGNDVEKIIDKAIRQSQKKAQGQAQTQLSEQMKKIKQPIKLKTKKVAKSKKPIKIKLPKFNWDKKPPKGKTYLVDVIVKSRGRVRKLAVKTTPNRALKLGANYVDNKLIRALDIKIIGYTSKKDIKAIRLPKFRTRKTKNTLRLVEKVKYALDRPTEKRNLRRARATKKAKRRVKKKVVRRKKRKV